MAPDPVRRLGWLLPLLLAAAPAGDGGIKAPQLAVRTLAALPKPLPAPYEASADAQRDVAAAAARAKASGKRLLIDFGANWCVDCRVLAGVLALPEMRRWTAQHFELVQVDVGAFDRNLDIAARYGVQPLGAIPAVFVIDPQTGKLLNRKAVLGLGDSRLMQPQQMANWLAHWAR